MTRRERNLRQKYGITGQQYARMLRAQKGACAICGKPPKARRLHVDHAHDETKRVRGLLCWTCNYYRVSKNTRATAWKVWRYLDSDFDGRNL